MPEQPFRPPPPTTTEGLISVGGPIDEACISLRIFGDDLDPDELTSKLGVSPTNACRKGDVHRGKKYDQIEKHGRWQYTKPNSPEPIDDQVVALLNDLTDDPDVWQDVASRFNVDLFVGVFMRDWNRGFDLSVPTLRLLADKRIPIGFDIYADADDESIADPDA